MINKKYKDHSLNIFDFNKKKIVIVSNSENQLFKCI